MAKDNAEEPDADEDTGQKLGGDKRRAGLRPDERDPDEPPGPPGSAGGGVNMAGTPAGGSAAGGLGGTNFGDGSVDDASLENVLGAGIYDDSGDTEATKGPYAGPAGGAVGGTPAGKRAQEGATHHSLDPNNDTGADQTIGAKPTAKRGKRGRKKRP
jgi:hypothetical protein